MLLPLERERNLLVLLAQAPSNTSTPSAGSLWMKWRSNRGNKLRKTCKRRERSLRAKWRKPSMSTKPTCSDRVSRTLFRQRHKHAIILLLIETFFHLARGSEATGGVAAYGGIQPGKAEKKGDAAQVRLIHCVVMKIKIHITDGVCQTLSWVKRQEEERRRREEEMLRKREMEEQMRRQGEDNYRMGNFMDVSVIYHNC